MNDSVHAFCHGDPGSMTTVSTVVSPSQRRHSQRIPGLVEPDVSRHATLERESIQDGGHRVGVDPAVDEDRGTLPGEFVDDVQQLQRPSIAVVSNWESRAHTTSGWIGQNEPTCVADPFNRFLRRLGTLSPSSRHKRVDR